MQQYNPKGDDGSVGVYGVTILKNYTWPGAITIGYVINYIIIQKKNSFSFIYIGYGHKLTQPTYLPIAPNDLQDEPDDIDEHHEPNPKNLPPPKPVEVDPEAEAEPIDQQE